MIDPRAGAVPPTDWPVLVTGAGGFVGGHVARELARVLRCGEGWEVGP